MAYRRTELVERRLADNRQRILDAARGIVAETGWRDAQIATIARRAELATGSVYHYFPSKADLFAEVLAEVSRHEVGVVTEIARGTGSVSERLAAAVRAFSTRALRARRLAYALIAEPCDPAIDCARLVYRRRLGEQFERLVSEGIDSGELAPGDARIAGACIVGALMEALVGPLAPEVVPDGEPAEEMLDELATRCVAAAGFRSTTAPIRRRQGSPRDTRPRRRART